LVALLQLSFADFHWLQGRKVSSACIKMAFYGDLVSLKLVNLVASLHLSYSDLQPLLAPQLGERSASFSRISYGDLTSEKRPPLVAFLQLS
jgi:hypothetical protein